MRSVIIVLTFCLTAGYVFYTYNQQQEVRIRNEQIVLQSEFETQELIAHLREKARLEKIRQAEALAKQKAEEVKAQALAAAKAAEEKAREAAALAQAELKAAEEKARAELANAQKTLEGAAADTLEKAENLKTKISESVEGVTAGLTEKIK